jgi:penicillin-binding protein 2
LNSRSHLRLTVLHVLVVSLLLTLAGRLWYLQVMNGDEYARIAADNRIRDIVVPAVRGQILDDVGRPLVRNRTALVVSVDRTALSRQPDGGVAVLRQLAAVLGKPYEQLAQKIRLCSPTVRRPCWPGSPFQPIPVDDRVSARKALQIMERQEDFPGISAQMQAVREYPKSEGASAAQVVGYLQPITQDELDRRKGLKVTGFSGVDLVGRDGLEAVYDTDLRGQPGGRQVSVDSKGRVTGTASEQAATPGAHIVTSIDAKVQALVEKSLERAIQRARAQNHRGEAAAGVVLDVKTGRVVALAGWPTYDPSIWIGGVSGEEYDKLLSKDQGEPLVPRATQGQFAPGSTFKISSTAAAIDDGYSLNTTYNCPGSFRVGNRAFRNFEGQGHGPMNLHRALVVSCDTIYYRFAYEQWLRDGANKPRKDPKDPMVRMARKFGFGEATGIDLPHEASGRLPDRKWKKEYWQETKKADCKHAKNGYPDLAKTDPARAAFLKAIAAENCQSGYVWRAGDAANFAIGQGDILVTPLQLANAYAALANGGTLYSPRIAKAIVRPDGTVVREIDPEKLGKLPVRKDVLAYMRRALGQVPKSGTAAGAFGGFPFAKLPVAGKTGTAEVFGKQDTSWFASFAPANNPRFAVVVMVAQAGQGSKIAAPAVREIYEGIYGLGGDAAKDNDKSKDKDGKAGAALPGGRPPDKLPKIRSDGTIAAPKGYGP